MQNQQRQANRNKDQDANREAQQGRAAANDQPRQQCGFLCPSGRVDRGVKMGGLFQDRQQQDQLLPNDRAWREQPRVRIGNLRTPRCAGRT